MFNEMLDEHNGVRQAYRAVAKWVEQSSIELLNQRRADAEALFRRIGITFAVGHPDFWTQRGLAIRSYRADKFLAQVIETTCSSRGEDEVQYNVVGVGSSLLGTYLDDELQTPQLWF